MFVKLPSIPEVVPTKLQTTLSGDSALAQPSSLAAHPTTEGWGHEPSVRCRGVDKFMVDL